MMNDSRFRIQDSGFGFKIGGAGPRACPTTGDRSKDSKSIRRSGPDSRKEEWATTEDRVQKGQGYGHHHKIIRDEKRPR